MLDRHTSHNIKIVKYKHHTESEKTLLFNEKFNRNTEISLLRDDSYPYFKDKMLL